MKTAMVESVKSAPGAVTNWWHNTRTFFTEVRNELKRVTWPSRTEVYATTLVVILTSIVFGVYLYGIDMLLNFVVGWVFRTFGAGA